MPSSDWSTLFNIIPPSQGGGTGGVQEIRKDGTTAPLTDVLPAPFAGWVVGEGVIYDPAEASNVVFFDTAAENLMQVFSGGSGNIAVEVGMNVINSGRSLTTEYGIKGTVDVMRGDNSVEQVTVELAKVGKPGMRWARYETTDGYGLKQVKMGQTLAELNAQTELNYIGWASADEVADRALKGYLMNVRKFGDADAQATRDRMIELGRQAAGDESLNDYEALTMFLNVAKRNLSGVARRVVKAE